MGAAARRRGAAAVVASGLLLSACTFSEVDPDATVTITGLAEPVEGGARSGVATLLVEPTGSDLLFGLPLSLGTLGAACLIEDPPPPCDTRRRQSLAASGQFRFEMQGRETQGMLGEAATVLVSAELAPTATQTRGPITTVAFRVQDETLQLPPLETWDGGLTLQTQESVVATTWDALPGSIQPVDAAAFDAQAPTSDPMSVSIFDGPHLAFERASGAILWATPAPGTAASLDRRVLEDAQSAAFVEVPAAGDALIRNRYVRSASIPFRSTAGAPASRGSACALGTQPPETPCRVTDGDLVTAWSPERSCAADACDEVERVRVDLGQPRPIELIVIRGCEGSCDVAIAGEDGTSQPVATVTAPFAALPLSPPLDARNVIVSGDILSLAEISAWDGPAATPPADADEATPGDVGFGGSTLSRPDEPGGRGWLLAIAAALLAMTLVGVGVAIGRRRSA